MALNTGFDSLDSSNNTFSDWLNKTNEMIVLMRNDVITANSTIANTDGDARLHGSFVANTFHVVNSLYGGNLYSNGDFDTANLVVSTNTYFSTDCDEVHIENDLRLSGNLIYIIQSSNLNDLIPSADCTYSLGNTDNEWMGYLCTLTVSGTTTLANLEVTGTASFNDVSASGEISSNNLTVSGTANVNVLDVTELSISGFTLAANTKSITTSSAQIIDSFDKSQSKGFKYIIHGSNSDAASVYTLELMCGHNGTDMYYTRYGELSNQFVANVVPQISGSSVQLQATCSSASVSNVHTFSVMRIETN